MAVPLLELERVGARYGPLQALFDVSLHVNEGEIVSLIGANGAGKTTVLRVISGLVRAAHGALRLAGEEISAVPAHRRVGRGISHVPEGRQLFPFMTVEENLLLGAHDRRLRPHARQMLQRQLDAFPRLAERRRQLAGTLSGGEQQMVAIARALMASPRLLLLDEPSLGLAPRIAEEVFALVARIRAGGVSVLLVEQNVVDGLDISDRGYVLERGAIALQGRASDLLADGAIRAAYLGL